MGVGLQAVVKPDLVEVIERGKRGGERGGIGRETKSLGLGFRDGEGD